MGVKIMKQLQGRTGRQNYSRDEYCNVYENEINSKVLFKGKEGGLIATKNNCVSLEDMR